VTKSKKPLLPKKLTTVTAFSKTLALILFITLPILGFYLGIYYKSSYSENSEPLFKIDHPSIPLANENLQSDLTGCIENKKQEVATNKMRYGKGMLIIQFQKDISFEESKKIIMSFNELSIINNLEIINGYLVAVPVGKELEYLCKLSTITAISSVNLNTIESTN